MSPSVKRLKQRPEFLRVAGSGRKWVAPGLILQARGHIADEVDNVKLFPLRVGFTVSRKVGNSPQRNRVRRRLRAAVDEIMPGHAMKGYDFVVIGRRATLKRPFACLLDDLKMALKKLHAYH